MLAEITAGLSSLKSASDLIQSLNDSKTQAAVNEVRIGLQERILEAHKALTAAQNAQGAAPKRISELEQEIIQLKDWEREKQRYQLTAIDNGAFAYVPKPGMENDEPPHWLCANCFNERRKSLLQFRGQERRPNGMRGNQCVYACSRCNTSLSVFYTRNPSKSLSASG